jgi:mannose/fructose/N-acetylgalactosamine-specific phosphotransferase system component IIB
MQLFRIDDRLIHGQVVIGWASYLDTNKIILCDDEVFQNEWEIDLYLSIVPDYIETLILNIQRTAELLNNKQIDLSKSIILVNSPKVIESLLDLGVNLEKVNIGGIHFHEGREKYLPYLYLAADEVETFKRIMRRGIQFDCLDVPQGKNIALEKLLNKKKH